MSSNISYDYKDAELWHRFLNGDNRAFSIIFDQYFDTLYRYGSVITPHKEIVEDSIQDIFIELWQSRARLKQTDSIKFYLFKVLRRKIYRNLDIRMDLHEDMGSYVKDTDDSIEQIIVKEEVSHQRTKSISDTIKLLSPRQREVIELRFYQEFSYEQIAELSDINLQSVHNNMHRALTGLRDRLSDFFD
jgi:RNA polymerase sigma-70 factor (ECF subfamily)